MYIHVHTMSSNEVGEDGQTMTATVAGIDGSGQPFEQVIVFDRWQKNDDLTQRPQRVRQSVLRCVLRGLCARCVC